MIADDLTLVIVGYRHQKYVASLLRSVEAQTQRPGRIILIDDDTSGATAGAAEDYLTDSELTVEVRRNTLNVGLCANLNRALVEIETEYYAYISADDWMMSTRVETQISAMRTAPGSVAASYSNAIRIDEHDNVLPDDFRATYKWPEARSGDIYTEICDWNWIPAPSVMLRTAAVRAVGGYDTELFFEDHDLWLRLALDHEFLCLEDTLVAFRELSTSLGHQQFQPDNPKFVLAYLQILSKQLGLAPEIQAQVEPKVWQLALRLWALEGPTDRAVSFLQLSVGGAQSQAVGRTYLALARRGVTYAFVDRLRALTGKRS